MSDISLKVLRDLRDRASSLLRNVAKDLAPFKKDDGTFRRKPDSRSPAWDTNVTTTCSCLMALASTDQFRNFYKQNGVADITAEDRALIIFRILLNAPWMSSGLTDNNAFTTTLILRAYGFLEQEKLFGEKPPKATSTDRGWGREWDLHLGIKNASRLANKLSKHADAASDFLWSSLSDDVRNLITNPASSIKSNKRLRAALALDLRKIIQSGWIYVPRRFGKASSATKQKLRRVKTSPSSYLLTSANRRLLADQYPRDISQPVERSLRDIAELIADDPENFSINQYPPSPAVVYWFVDGITRAKIRLSPSRWDVLCKWAAKEFNHRRSLVVADHDAMMDPIAMGMCACLCARLRAITEKPSLGGKREHLTILPSRVELERSIEELISKQTNSGIWNKYFPLFHYQDAGSNFCFTFELLEAILYEFGQSSSNSVGELETDANALFANPKFVEGLEKAVTWCEKNRLSCSEGSNEYNGWNSGGQIDTLEKGQPESWATGVVHMFLSELTTVLSEQIQDRVLKKYKARFPKNRERSDLKSKKRFNPTALNDLLDIDILLRNKTTKVSSVLRTSIIQPYRRETEKTLRRRALKKPLSALLFGPPGTSKTEIVKAIADELGWPLVEITPSEFVKGTLANVYLQADEIFDDLMDLSGVVIFFDEMDALVQTREGETRLDIASQFLTTTMLPKLTRLHDHARAVFLMATNFQERFDAAIKRAGRFDLLLCMGPPRLNDKLHRIHRVYGLKESTEQTARAGDKLRAFLKGSSALQDQLALFTFGEYKAFLNTIGKATTVGDAAAELGATRFKEQLRDYSQYVMLKLSDADALRSLDVVKWKRLADLRKKKLDLKKLPKESRSSDLIRYLVDWQQSKEQY
jgi:ATPase family associated with various cellular activities (AAA)